VQAADVLHGSLQQQDKDWDIEVKHLCRHSERVCGGVGAGAQDTCCGGQPAGGAWVRPRGSPSVLPMLMGGNSQCFAMPHEKSIGNHSFFACTAIWGHPTRFAHASQNPDGDRLTTHPVGFVSSVVEKKIQMTTVS
jgi:hypothetical protein